MRLYYSFFLSLLLLWGAPLGLKAQLPEAVSNPAISATWLGLDFEEALIIGDASLDMDSFRGIYAKKINDMINSESRRYDFKKYLLKNEVRYDTAMLNESNADIFKDNFVPSAPGLQSFTPAALQALVNGYTFKNQDGLAVVFIVRAMNKTKGTLTGNFTYIDRATKTILFTREYTATAGGVEWAAYWANGFRRILIALQSDLKKG